MFVIINIAVCIAVCHTVLFCNSHRGGTKIGNVQILA